MRTVNPLHVRWLGTVPYREAHDLQRALFTRDGADWLLLLEHPHVYTLGVRADLAHVLVPPASVGADLVKTDRGGDVTYHGPGQLVGYPILSLPGKRGGGMADTVAYVRAVEQLVIDTVVALGLPDVGRLPDHPGVWVAPASDNPRKVAAIGVKLTRGRSMHGFALNVAPDLTMFDHIVPCGIKGKAVTSLAAEGLDVTVRDVVDVLVEKATLRWAADRPVTRAGVLAHEPVGALDFEPLSAAPIDPAGPSRQRAARLAQAEVTEGLAISQRKPDWLRAQLKTGEGFVRLKRTMRELGLVTVCEEAGCPNIYECWADGTATFMINGERCTRACGFCLVDTSKPMPLDASEPQRVATAVAEMGLTFAVLTAVARDDLPDGGAGAFAACIAAIRDRTPQVQVEVLIPDCKGDEQSLAAILDARPDVLNHNIETVARLQRAVRPSAGYARSLTVLARAKAAGLTAKSGMIVGMGESFDEVVETLSDLAGVGVDIVTIGQYLRPTTAHIPVARWWEPSELDELRRIGEADLGIAHVEASPLTRSSYHAKRAASGVVPVELSLKSAT